MTAPFESILSPCVDDAEAVEESAALHDLALDQVFARLDEGAPRAQSAFRTFLRSTIDVEYRQAVFQVLEDPRVRNAVEEFIESVAECDLTDDASSRSDSREARQLWHLRSVADYVTAVETFCTQLEDRLDAQNVRSEGWQGLARHLHDYRASSEFASLATECLDLRDQAGRMRSNVLIRGAKVSVAPVDEEEDLSHEVMATFARFRHDDDVDHRTDFRPPGLDHVQLWILERVARVHPAFFARLSRFARDTETYRDRVLMRFVDEVRFYLAYLDFLEPLRQAGLPTCYPRVSSEMKTLTATDTWDVTLAVRLVHENIPVVLNTMCLEGDERILVVSGPNQGGKTTTARIFGQLHHLAAIGCPVPGNAVEIFLADMVLTLFEREEQLDDGQGRLGAEIAQLHTILSRGTGRSVIVLNEAFSSTALSDARVLTRDVLSRISDRDALAACVTFIDEMSRLNEKTVSMVSMVDPEDPAVRTFRVERRAADGKAYARALAQKHGLTKEAIRSRLRGRADASITDGGAR